MRASNTAAVAKYVMDRLKETDVAVFVLDGEVKTLFPAGARFDLMCDEVPGALVGVYTLNGCCPEMIEDDIKATHEGRYAKR